MCDSWISSMNNWIKNLKDELNRFYKVDELNHIFK
jgi:hypothetical protein